MESITESGPHLGYLETESTFVTESPVSENPFFRRERALSSQEIEAQMQVRVEKARAIGQFLDAVAQDKGMCDFAAGDDLGMVSHHVENLFPVSLRDDTDLKAQMKFQRMVGRIASNHLLMKNVRGMDKRQLLRKLFGNVTDNLDMSMNRLEFGPYWGAVHLWSDQYRAIGCGQGEGGRIIAAREEPMFSRRFYAVCHREGDRAADSAVDEAHERAHVVYDTVLNEPETLRETILHGEELRDLLPSLSTADTHTGEDYLAARERVVGELGEATLNEMIGHLVGSLEEEEASPLLFTLHSLVSEPEWQLLYADLQRYSLRLPPEQRHWFVEVFNPLFSDFKAAQDQAQQIMVELRDRMAGGEVKLGSLEIMALLGEMEVAELPQLTSLWGEPAQDFLVKANNERCRLRGSNDELVTRFLSAGQAADRSEIEYRAQWWSADIISELAGAVEGEEQLGRAVGFLEKIVRFSFDQQYFGGQEMSDIFNAVDVLKEKSGQFDTASQYADRLDAIKDKVLQANPKYLKVPSPEEITDRRSSLLESIREGKGCLLSAREEPVLYVREGLEDFVEQALIAIRETRLERNPGERSFYAGFAGELGRFDNDPGVRKQLSKVAEFINEHNRPDRYRMVERFGGDLNS